MRRIAHHRDARNAVLTHPGSSPYCLIPGTVRQHVGKHRHPISPSGLFGRPDLRRQRMDQQEVSALARLDHLQAGGKPLRTAATEYYYQLNRSCRACVKRENCSEGEEEQQKAREAPPKEAQSRGHTSYGLADKAETICETAVLAE